MENKKARCSKLKFWGLKFELIGRIAYIPRNSLTEIINIAANRELILEQEETIKKNNFTPKSIVSTPLMIEYSKEKMAENPSNPNKQKRDREKKH